MVSFRKLIKVCRPSKYRHEKTDEDPMQHRLVYRYDHPHTDQPAIFSSYCPIMPCSAVHSFRRREKEVTDWLITHFVDQFGPGKKVDLLWRSDLRLLVCLHQIFAAELRLLEVYFSVNFAWSGFERQIPDESYIPFTYTRPGLAQYYRQESLFHSGGRHGETCKSHRYQKCSAVVEDMVDACFPRHESGLSISPDFRYFNHAQMIAWSLATSVSTIASLGFALDSNAILNWGLSLLESWESKLRDAMKSGDDVEGKFNSSCPQYTPS
ncbi:hypothetical protein PCL_07060 [Purpureocillium lilacinum]|uniref:Uncharacterized protein n=1 Tax=Purpureocillium lilacinum TaxID=33203 RepID=A0A2U3DT86_PURLI|nr:hypothetical protein PCL_07060 [Purpureocillium lilacinum]